VDVVPLISIETTVVLRADPSECSEFIPEDATSRLKIRDSNRALALALGSTPHASKGRHEIPLRYLKQKATWLLMR
jgi:hypothetical protein